MAELILILTALAVACALALATGAVNAGPPKPGYSERVDYSRSFAAQDPFHPPLTRPG